MEFVKKNQNTDYMIVKMAEFAPINIFLSLIIFISAYFMYCLRNIKDNETLGIKFEVLCSVISSVVGKYNKNKIKKLFIHHLFIQ